MFMQMIRTPNIQSFLQIVAITLFANEAFVGDVRISVAQAYAISTQQNISTT